MAGATTAAVVIAAPAQAASIGGETLLFGGVARLENEGVVNGGFSQLDFRPYDNSPAQGIGTILDSFTNFGSGNFKIGDLNLQKTGATTWALASGPVTDWLTELDNGVEFTLSSFNLEKDTDDSFDATIEGLFTPANLDGTGAFSAQGGLSFSPGTSFSANITAGQEVPTPALLPGLLGVGIAALRKRKSEELESADA